MSSAPPSGVVTRFAPSPTGHLHVGGARTAMFCWAFAKRAGGRFMLRIEDTDAARSSDESARGIMEDLAWLGLEWDDGPALPLPDGRVVGANARAIEGGYFQARRTAIYNRAIEQLVRAGRAYPAFERGDEIEAQRKAAVAAKQTYRYARPAEIAYGVFNDALEARWARACNGESHVVRFAAPHEEIVVHDQVLGDVRIAPGELDDFVLRKGDGLPTYHFAVVVDDHAMGVTHVLRAQEHLANTPRHVALQRALGYPAPAYAHLPLIFNADGSKMSKRDKAKAARKALKDALAKNAVPSLDALGAEIGVDAALLRDFADAANDALDIAERIGKRLGVALPEIEVADFREAGYAPEAICNFLALLGWNPGLKTPDGKDLEKFDLAFLAANFSLERIGRTNAKFDRAKLLSFNATYLAALPDDEFARRWGAWLAECDPAAHARLARDRVSFALLARTVKPRAKTFRDAVASSRFAMIADDGYGFDAAAVEKHLKADAARGLALVREFRERLAALPAAGALEPAAVDAIVQALVAEHGLANPGPIAQAIRVAVAGVPVTPGIGETLAILGRASALARLDRCLATIA
ncbi:MAG: glutamate--tRNA ligase [Planctomycetota bacterium]|nr:glutamate--tRNA ligase [Planctomycetota bacterium]